MGVITVAYASDDPAVGLDLGSLSISVNGLDWTSRFAAAPSSASYTVSAEDTLVAGTITVQASIADLAGGRADTSQSFELHPKLLALVPPQGRPGDPVTISALGADPDPARNVLSFRSLTNPLGIATPFLAVDRVAGTGTVAVPDGAVTGPVALEVNGQLAAERPAFTVLSALPVCGTAQKVVYMADGGMNILYSEYDRSSTGTLDLRCPNLQFPLPNLCPGRGAAVRISPAGVVTALAQDSCFASVFTPGTVLAMAVDKARTRVAVLRQEPVAFVFNLRVQYNGRIVTIGTAVQGFGPRGHVDADFDGEGNLFFSGFQDGEHVLLKVTAEQLATKTVAEPEVIARGLVTPFSTPALAVGCDGSGYLGVNLPVPASSDHQVLRVDLVSGLVLATSPIRPGEQLFSMIATCQDELWGLAINLVGGVAPRLWRVPLTPDPPAIGPFEDRIFFSRPVGFALSVTAGGRIQVHPGALGNVEVDRTGVCLIDGRTTAFPSCGSRNSIQVLPSTTRWKPQKDTTTPIVVNFTAPKGHTPTALDITDATGGVLANQNIAISGPADPNADPGQYMITWTGPWSWTDSTTGQLQYRAAGNYTFTIRGTKADSTPLNSDPAKPCFGAATGTPSCSVVSLVEVTAVDMMDKPGTRGRVRNSELGGPGGGWAIFPEARNPSPNDQVVDEDKMEILAAVTPAVPDPRAQGPVTVYFRSIDVDDSSAGTDPITGASSPVDDESLALDNCPGVVCAVPKAGNLNSQDGDAPVPVSLPSGQTQVTADLQVSRRQGDNYRVSASTSGTWLQGLSAKQNSLSGEVFQASGESVLDTGGAKGPQVSEMLTVWRTLHLEVDGLASLNPTADQNAMDAGPGRSFTRLMSTRLDDSASPPAFYRADHPQPNDWRGADLTTDFHATDRYDVRDSDIGSVTVNLGFAQPDLLKGQSDPFIIDRSYRLRDDDLTSLNTVLDYSLATSLLARAYIQLVPLEQVADQSTIPLGVDPLSLSPPFNRNLSAQTQYSMPLPVGVPSTKSYWSVALIKAFDTGVFDLDPTDKVVLKGNPPKPTLGVEIGNTTRGPLSGPFQKYRSAVFVETLRDLYAKPPTWFLNSLEAPGVLNPDFNTTVRRVTAHEIMHTFQLPHGADDLMCAYVNLTSDPAGDKINDDQLSIVRKVDVPRTPASDGSCPH